MDNANLEQGLTARTARAIGEVLAGRRTSGRARLLFVGPAIIASIAYMDPGNFATNLQAGARYGYALLWVVLGANIVAMLFQSLSAKLGIVTNRNLAEMCREQLPLPLVHAMWGISEIAAMGTDLAEFLGGAIGLSLLFQLPLIAGMVITGLVTYSILMAKRRGISSGRAHHRRSRRCHCAVLSCRTVLCSRGVERRRARHIRATATDPGCPYRRGRHVGCHGNAPCHLFALGPPTVPSSEAISRPFS